MMPPSSPPHLSSPPVATVWPRQVWLLPVCKTPRCAARYRKPKASFIFWPLLSRSLTPSSFNTSCILKFKTEINIWIVFFVSLKMGLRALHTVRQTPLYNSYSKICLFILSFFMILLFKMQNLSLSGLLLVRAVSPHYRELDVKNNHQKKKNNRTFGFFFHLSAPRQGCFIVKY